MNIRWAWVLPEPGNLWQYAFSNALDQLSISGRAIKLATGPRVSDILIIGYRATDYGEIVKLAALGQVIAKQCLSSDPKILLLACDFAEPEVDQNMMSDLVISQVKHLSSSIRTVRAFTPEDLGIAVEQFLLFHLPMEIVAQESSGNASVERLPESEWDF